MVQVETARELEVLDGRHEQHAADDSGTTSRRTRSRTKPARPRTRKRRDERPAREQEEERHVPEADEAADDEHQPNESSALRTW